MRIRIMGKNIAHSFYELGIFVFFLYSSKVLSAPSVPTVIDVMLHDKELCNGTAYVYENKITKECNTVPYPEGDLSTDSENRKIYLCLALYDTMHKHCQSNSVKVPFKNATAFESYIRKFLPGSNEVEQTSFCENIKHFKFSYEKLIPLLPHVSLDKLNVCYRMCIDMSGEFIPLCGILAWSKSIDDKMVEVNENKDMSFHRDTVSTQLTSDVNQHKQQESNFKAALDKITNGRRQGIPNSDTKNVKSIQASNVDVAENNVPNNKPKNDTDNKDRSITIPKNKDIQYYMYMTNSNVRSKNGHSQAETKTINDDEVKTGNGQQQVDIIQHDAKDNTVNSNIEITMNSLDITDNANNKMQTKMNSNVAKDNIANSKMETNVNSNDQNDYIANSKAQTNMNSNDAKDKSERTELQTNANNEIVNDKSMDTDVQTGANKGIPLGHGTADSKKESSETLQKAPGDKDELVDPKNVENANEDIKISIPSQNIQDHENSANEYENPMEDEKFSNDPNDAVDQPLDTAEQAQSVPEPSEQRDITSRYHSIRTDEESHFFTYFTIVSLISIAAYIGYHNKQKILAIVLEGRRSRSSRGRRRPSTANYRKLDCTLEEAVTSQCNANVTHVIY